MIINSLNNKKIKILIDLTDLNNAEIPLFSFISSSKNASSYIKKLLLFYNKTKKDIFLNKEIISFKNYTIYTYNYNIFLININL